MSTDQFGLHVEPGSMCIDRLIEILQMEQARGAMYVTLQVSVKADVALQWALRPGRRFAAQCDRDVGWFHDPNYPGRVVLVAEENSDEQTAEHVAAAAIDRANRAPP